MPFNPDTPRSRDEVLLRAIVSGDSSAMGDPRDREEEFVKAIADKETLPDYSEASEGDTLQIGADGPEWAATPNELPAIAAGDAGKVLKVNAGETGTEWGNIPNELPTIGSGDAGKVLKVNSGETGTEWGAIESGGKVYKHSIVIHVLRTGTNKFQGDVYLTLYSASSTPLSTQYVVRDTIGDGGSIATGYDTTNNKLAIRMLGGGLNLRFQFISVSIDENNNIVLAPATATLSNTEVTNVTDTVTQM